MLPPFTPEQVISGTIKEEWGRLMAILIKQCGDFQLAEDSLQDAVVIALKAWPNAGIPDNPSAWLMTTARRKAIDRLRRDQNFKTKAPEVSYLMDLENRPADDEDIDRLPDKRLEMIFTCCHPALEEKTRIALTLRTLGGLSTDEIADAFLDKPSAMGQRLSRAKKKITLAGIPYEIPDQAALPERLSSVLSVIYLIFNAGYGLSNASTHLNEEAIRLGRILYTLLPEETEVAGLLALMLLHDARRIARQDADGNLVPLSEQNRQRWDKSRHNEGADLIHRTFQKQDVGPYQIQAAISALHGNVQSWEQTDWPQICDLYALLYRIQPTAVVRLNQSVALSYSGETKAGLEMLQCLKADLADYQPYYAAVGELNQRQGNLIAAKAGYEQAIKMAENDAERRFLMQKLKNIRLQ